MPSAKVLSEKKKIVEEMTGKLKSRAGVFVDYSGITVNEDTGLRVKMREANVDYSVVKNTLMRFAIKNVGLDELDQIFHGTTSLAVSDDDPIAPARVVKEHVDLFTNCFEIKGGFMDGKALSVDEIKAIANIPPLPILQAQLLGTMLAPITSLAVVLKAIVEKGGESVETESEPPAETAAEAPAAEPAPVEAVAEAPVAEPVPAEASAEVSAAEPAPAEAAVEAPAAEPAPVEASAEAPAAEPAPAEAAAEAPAAEPAPVKAAAKAPAKKTTRKAPAKKDASAESTDEAPTEESASAATEAEAPVKKPARKPATKKTAPKTDSEAKKSATEEKAE